MKNYKYKKYDYPFEKKLIDFDLPKDWVIKNARVENGTLIFDYLNTGGIDSITINIDELVTNEKIPVENYEEIQIRAI